MGEKQLKIIRYVDDAILLSQSKDDLQRIRHQFHITSRKFNMLIFPKKTQCMVTPANLLRCKLELEDPMIEHVIEFKYSRLYII
ncbi:unnamed protein product [Diabrotica balteata]|uniref:Reverse transcriptase domain-containing protein n=1 Tax=Diabrotica balteata TaxID=107213 RepID=A0A9N9T7A8_DIABA|nr:unnamed protein product [Diabrotica balteata]